MQVKQIRLLIYTSGITRVTNTRKHDSKVTGAARESTAVWLRQADNSQRHTTTRARHAHSTEPHLSRGGDLLRRQVLGRAGKGLAPWHYRAAVSVAPLGGHQCPGLVTNLTRVPDRHRSLTRVFPEGCTACHASVCSDCLLLRRAATHQGGRGVTCWRGEAPGAACEGHRESVRRANTLLATDTHAETRDPTTIRGQPRRRPFWD
ncbi:hypothetical protein E2C01_055206 [Portunus trituberculatus]|uniref:Uncharacterized protein n=1 Tax=Portunus trituberculatus TaxID=210409 RepID=A0A5B7GLY7_PORTR|nr:hypothetical protein [Portunus trituberculatus]